MGESSRSRKVLRKITTPFILFPTIVIYSIFLIFPLLYGLYLSLTKSIQNPTFTLENYAYCLSTYYPILINTIELAVLVTVILIIISLPIAYVLAIKIKSDAIKTLILIAMLAPFWIDWNIRMMGWYPVFGAGGFISNIHSWIMYALGYHNVAPISLLYSIPAIIITWIQSYLLFMVMPIYLLLLRMNPNLLKAASTLRADSVRTFYYITFKWSLPGIMVGSLFVFSQVMVDYATPLLIGGGLPTIGVTIWELGGWVRWPEAMAMSTIILIVIFIVVAIILRKISITRVLW